MERPLWLKEVARSMLLPALLFALVAGLSAGIGIFTFFYARGPSYFFDKPETCANCHVMNTVFEGWTKGGHQFIATCNDCHVPHNFLGKWYTKGENGFHHSFAFTFQKIPLVIHARENSKNIVQGNCLRCHSSMAEHAQWGDGPQGEPLPCISCHRDAGHPHN